MSTAHTTPVDLKSLIFEPRDPAADKVPSPILFLHGLFGNKRNASTIAQKLANKTQRAVHTLDLRNHGDSPHASPMSYSAMAADVYTYLRKMSIRSCVMMGHSMGGKCAMTMALEPQYRASIERLIVVDITPAKGGVQDEFGLYIKAMRRAVQEGANNRKDCAAILEQSIPSSQIRLFLMTNWQKQAEGGYQWRIPLDLLESSFPEIGDFPFDEGQQTFNEATLFIKGEQSKYINSRTLEVARTYFPSLQLETVKGASHWVHSDQPARFEELVNAFCRTH